MRHFSLLRLALVLVVPLAGCKASISDPASKHSGSTGSTSGFALTCEEPGITPGPAPLARLTNTEYANTIADLFPAALDSSLSLPMPGEVTTDGFLNNAQAHTPSADVVDALHQNATAVATTANLSKILPCTPASAADEPACGQQFIRTFGKKAFRRPLSDDELSRYGDAFTDWRSKWGFNTAIQLLVEAFLQSPNFLYRVEPGNSAATVDGKAVPLGGYEMASRLSYLLTDSMPDDALLSAAGSGKLDTADGVESEARRLLATPRARKAVADFMGQWLRFDKLDSVSKSSTFYPDFSQTTAAALKASTVKYVDHLVWDEGFTLKALLTDNHAYVNDSVAALWDLPSPGPQLTWTTVDAKRRSGILTQAGLMAAFAHQINDAPVLRGVFVLDRLLCAPTLGPPNGVNLNIDPPAPGSATTTRQQLEQSHASGSCVACHKQIDGIGFGFEHYDAVGKWRDLDNGVRVDATGTLVGVDVSGNYDGAVELGAKLAASAQVQACTVKHGLSYALGVTREEVSPCVSKPVFDRFGQTGDFRELLVDIATSNGFRYRPPLDP